jgi:molybdopterin converting factor small subunit
MTLVEKSTFSVDQEYVQDSKQLYHDAEVGLIPPVSGG